MLFRDSDSDAGNGKINSYADYSGLAGNGVVAVESELVSYPAFVFSDFAILSIHELATLSATRYMAKEVSHSIPR